MNLNLKKIKIFAWTVVVLSVICSFTLWGQRFTSEEDYKHVQVLVNYNDILALSNANDLSHEALASALQQRGVTAVLFKELSLGDLDNSGRVSLELGYNIKNASFYSEISKDLVINEANMYVAILDKALEEQVKKHILLKAPGAQYYEGETGVIAIPVMVPTGDKEVADIRSWVKELGVGFQQEGIMEMADFGFQIVPQLRTWENASAKAMRAAAEEIKQMPNLSHLLFNDKEIPGYPDDIRVLADLLKDPTGKTIVPVGTIEFSEQKGLNQLGVLLNKDVVRLHTIANNEMTTYTQESAMDRWLLAVNERNMRCLLVRFFDIETPNLALTANLDYLEELQHQLLDAGFVLNGDITKPVSIQVNNNILYLIGIGVAAGLMLILLEMRLPKLSIFAFVGTSVMWIGLFLLSPVLAKKLMALASVMVFPTLSCLLIMKPQARSLGQTILALLKMCAISFIGAILMVGLLADVLFMLKLDQFVGVKFAHVVPIMVVPLVLYIWNTDNPLRTIKGIFDKAVEYKWAILGCAVAAAGYIYISRTGNTTTELSAGEELMRTYLNDILGVRPRTKEFLLGYPFTILLLYYGASKGKWVFTLPAIIGQVSLVNTYAHIHTSLLISLHRSLNGLLLGILIGLLLLAAVKFILKWYHKMEQKERWLS